MKNLLNLIIKNTKKKINYYRLIGLVVIHHLIPSPPSITSTHIGDKLIHMANQGAMNTPASKMTKSRNFLFGAQNVTGKEGDQRTLLLNNKPISYIIDTDASISVISEDTARILGAKISPYDRSRIKAMTADGKEVKDVLGFAEAEVTLGNQKLTNARMYVFKNLTNPCLIGRDILSAHTETKDHFEAIIGKMKDNPQIANKLHIKPCIHQHKDRSSDDDYDEMDDLKFKGCWSKNKA